VIQYRQGTSALIRRSVFREIRLESDKTAPSSEPEFVIQERGQRADELGLVPGLQETGSARLKFGLFTARAPSAGNVV